MNLIGTFTSFLFKSGDQTRVSGGQARVSGDQARVSGD